MHQYRKMLLLLSESTSQDKFVKKSSLPKKMLKTYSCRRDLSRRQRWLYASRSGAETTDLELVLDPNEPNGSPILVPVHACILVS